MSNAKEDNPRPTEKVMLHTRTFWEVDVQDRIFLIRPACDSAALQPSNMARDECEGPLFLTALLLRNRLAKRPGDKHNKDTTNQKRTFVIPRLGRVCATPTNSLTTCRMARTTSPTQCDTSADKAGPLVNPRPLHNRSGTCARMRTWLRPSRHQAKQARLPPHHSPHRKAT